MSDEAIEVVSESSGAIVRAQEMSVEEIVARVEKVKEVQRRVMKEGIHYGKVPGVDKPTLLKPGAEILGMVFRLDTQFEVTEQRDGDHLTDLTKCVLYHQDTGARLGSGVGSCSTKESKYAWRNAARKCTACGKEAIIKGKSEYGGGWVCFKKKNGCGQKYSDDDPAIIDQPAGRVPNPDIADTYNTVLKMSCKRAHVAAILFVTCASEIFTQDVEEDMGIAPSNEGRKEEVSIEGILTAYSEARDVKGINQANAAVRSVMNDITDLQRKSLEKARDEALQRIQAAEKAMADDAERAMG